MPAPIGFHVKVDAAQATRFLTDVLRKQLPFIMAKSLTLTAKDVQAELKKQLPQVFDRPNRWTMNSLFMKPATKSKLSAMVGLKDGGEGKSKGTPAVKYLLPEIQGGDRRFKRFEKAFEAIGVLPKGMMMVPGKAAKMDSSGNMKKSHIVEILKHLRGVSVAVGGQAKAVPKYFVVREGARNLAPGVWRTFDGDRHKIKPVLLFVKTSRYAKRWKFYEAAKRVALDRFGIRFNETASQVLKG